MAEQALAKIFQQVEGNLADANAVKVSLARKREYVFTVQELIKQLEPRKIIQIQAATINFVFQLASQTQSGPMVAGLIGLVRFMYQNGADFTKLVQEFFEPAIAVIQNARTPAEFRQTMIQMTGKVFKTLWMRCSTPPTKELFEAYTKLPAKTTDSSVRAAAYVALKHVIRDNPSNLFQMQNDLIKHLIRQLKDEKSSNVKSKVAACLVVFIQHTINYSNMHSQFESLWQVCLKGFEEVEDMEVHENYVLAGTALLNMRLQESQQQGDIKTGYKQYNVTLRENLAQSQTKKGKRGDSQAVLDVPRTLGDIISMFAAMLLRLLQNVQASTASGETSELTNAQEGIRKAISQILCRIAERNVAHLEATDIEVMLNSLVLTIPTGKDEPEESQRHRLSCVWSLKRLVELMQDEQRIALLKLCLQTLTQKQFMLKMETLQNLTVQLPKNFKVSTMLNEAQHTALLQITNELIHSISCKTLQANFQSEAELMDAITPYLQQPSPYSVRLTGVEVLKMSGSKVSAWSNTMITRLLSMTTMSNADILSLRPEAVYVIEAVKDRDARLYIIDQIRTLNCQAMALAGVFQYAQNATSGVPVALTTATINLAKKLILGNLPLDVRTNEEKEMFKLQNIDSVTNQRREAGWILIEGLLNLGSDWIMSEMILLMKLFKTVFRKEICTIELEMMKTGQPTYKETVFNEFMIKKRAVGCLKSLLTIVNLQVDQHKNALRQVSGMVCNAVNFFLNQGEKLDIDKMIHKQFGTNQIQGAKADLLACLLLLPQEAYQSKFVTLLHPIVEIIIHEDGGPSKIPSIFKRLLHRDDSHIKPTVSQLKNSGKPSKKNQEDALPKEIDLDTRCCIWGVQDVTDYTRQVTEVHVKDYIDRAALAPLSDALTCYPRQNLLNNAIELFSRIFLSDSLNNKNKNQLLKHFTINVQPSAPAQETTKEKKQAAPQQQKLPYYRPDKTCKMIRIALALLNIIKKVSELPEQKKIGDEQFVMILAILSSIELSNNDFLIRIVAEIYVLLQAPKISTHPEETLSEVIAELEGDVGNGQVPAQMTPIQTAGRTVKFQKAAAILGLLMRNFDYESLLAPFADRMAALMTRIMRDESIAVRTFSQHYVTIMASEGPCPEALYQKAFLNCYHLYQLDSKVNLKHQANLGKLFNTYTKSAEQIDSRSRAEQGDLFDSLLEHKTRRSQDEVFMVALDAVKFHVLKDPASLSNSKWKDKLFETVLTLVQDEQLKKKVKVKVTELLAALIYLGHLYGLEAASKESLARIVLDQINNLNGESSDFLDSSIADALSSNLQFEQLINFSAEFNLETREESDSESFARPHSSSRVYLTCLKQLYLFIFKMQCLADFKEAIQFCKSMLAYKHTTPFTILERVLTDGQAAQPAATGENYIFKQDMRDETRCFVMRVFQTYVELFFELDPLKDQAECKAEASSLLTLGFSTVSHDDEHLKQIGFDLTLTMIDLLSQVSDRVQDDADEEEEAQVRTAEAIKRRKIKDFLDSQLLLEQYEAQIFSIIRQNLKESSQGVLNRVYQLILRYLTLPICRDEQTIAKIRDLLLAGCTLEPSRIYLQNIDQSEHSVAMRHLSKLNLICKLLVFSKHGKDHLSDDHQPSASIKRKLDLTLPSKFRLGDQVRLQDVLIAGSSRGVLTSHLVGCLNDALIINLGKRANMKKCKIINFGPCTPQSALGQSLQKQVQYALEALSILVSSPGADDTCKLSAEESKTVTLSLLQKLSRHDISGSFDNEQIRQYSQSKLAEWVQAKCFIDDPDCTVLKGSPQELSEFCDVLASQVKLRVFEVNQMVLTLVQSLLKQNFFNVFNALMSAQKLEVFVELINGLFLQAVPALVDDVKKDENFGGNGFEMGQATVSTLSKSDLTVPNQIAVAQAKGVFDVALSIVGIAKIGDEDGVSQAIKKAVAYSIGRLLVQIEKVPQATSEQQELKKALVMHGTNTINCMSGDEAASKALLSAYLGAIRLNSAKKAEFSPFSGALIHAILVSIAKMVENKQDLVREASLALTSGEMNLLADTMTTRMQLLSSLMARDPLPGPIGQTIVAYTLAAAFNEVKKSGQPDERALLLALALNLQFYKARADLATRVCMLRPLFTLLFTVMQGPNLSAQTRNQAVEILYQLFSTDQAAFKKFAEPNTAGQSWLTIAEKDIVSKVVQKYAAMQQQTAPAQAAAQQTSAQPAKLGRQPLATKGGNKIKLGRFGKK